MASKEESPEHEALNDTWQTPVLLNHWTAGVQASVDGGSSEPTVIFVLPPDYRAKNPLP